MAPSRSYDEGHFNTIRRVFFNNTPENELRTTIDTAISTAQTNIRGFVELWWQLLERWDEDDMDFEESHDGDEEPSTLKTWFDSMDPSDPLKQDIPTTPIAIRTVYYQIPFFRVMIDAINAKLNSSITNEDGFLYVYPLRFDSLNLDAANAPDGNHTESNDLILAMEYFMSFPIIEISKCVLRQYLSSMTLHGRLDSGETAMTNMYKIVVGIDQCRTVKDGNVVIFESPRLSRERFTWSVKTFGKQLAKFCMMIFDAGDGFLPWVRVQNDGSKSHSLDGFFEDLSQEDASEIIFHSLRVRQQLQEYLNNIDEGYYLAGEVEGGAAETAACIGCGARIYRK